MGTMIQGSKKVARIILHTEYEGATEDFVIALSKSLRDGGMPNEMIMKIRNGEETTLKEMIPRTDMVKHTTFHVIREEEGTDGQSDDKQTNATN
jgi:hypothetical protein